jgi:NAD-dependent dihydropyrimidine dehydrogenase PreA subunit
MKFKKRFGISASTWAFWHEGRQSQDYHFTDWLHGYLYGRWTYLYIGLGIKDHPTIRRIGTLITHVFHSLKKVTKTIRAGYVRSPSQQGSGTIADTYHGKVVPLQAARQLVLVNEPIHLPNLEQVMPYPKARDLILKNPDHIVVLECPCRSARPNPCLPLDVCLIVGEPFASFVVEHHPTKSRWINQSEAVAILEAEDRRGHVHHAFFKDAMLNRFYAICNCCSCCCGAMQSQRNGVPMLASSGYVCQVDEELCIGCESCVESCQFGALSLDNFGMTVDETACMGCGVCIDKCSEEALSLRREPSRGEPLEILSLMEKAAVS